MAARTGAHPPVGSRDWILKEFNDISTLCENELEDFTFSARNEAEWLNEHMADIFSSGGLYVKTVMTQSRMCPLLTVGSNLAEIMKTPGKLRGKTPRTIRQRSPLKELRQPLGEIAAINKRFNSPMAPSPKKTPAKLKSSQNASIALQVDPVKVDRSTKDSGYHGDSDSMEVERELPATQDMEAEERRQEQQDIKYGVQSLHNGVRSTEGSFHSAEENHATRNELQAPEAAKRPSPNSEAERASEQLRRESAEQIRDDLHDSFAVVSSEAQIAHREDDAGDASSENSTPAKGLIRKSSITFPVLPAREPLATKKSMGNRVSGQTAALSRSGYHQRYTDGKSFGKRIQSDNEDDEDDHDEEEHRHLYHAREESDGSDAMVRIHKKTNTAKLHERISALGRPQQSRPTKSIPSNIIAGQTSYPVLPPEDEDDTAQAKHRKTMNETDTEMPPPSTAVSKSRSPSAEHGVPYLESAQSSAQIGAFASLHATKERETEQRSSTTPAGSPPKHLFQQGPLNASKSKLQSIMQSARGLFSSSAAASAQAKLEAASLSSPKKEKAQAPVFTSPESAKAKQKAIPEARRTRSSQEGENQQKLQSQNAIQTPNPDGDGVSDDMDEPGDDRSTQQDQENTRSSPQIQTNEEEDELAERPQSAMAPPARPRTILQKPGTTKRPLTKPTREVATQQKVSIKIGSLAGRRPLTATTLSSASKAHEGDTQTRSGAGGKKESTASQSTTASSAPSFKSSTASVITKPKALLAAERKKEADQKAAQKKLEQKRELERRKAAQQEEAQKREQERQAAERQRERERQAEEERKKQEQRQAVEKKRAEQLARREQMQREAGQHALKASTQRPDAIRPPSRQATLQDFPKPPGAQHQAATAKASKRVWHPDQDEAQKPTRTQANHGYQQTLDGKRRKTEDEETIVEGSKRPAMAPPVRISNILKNGPKPSIFGNYPRAPPPASHHQASTAAPSQAFKQSYGGQGPAPTRPGTAMDIARFQNGAIPFATSSHAVPTSQITSAAAVFKTPSQPSKFGQPQTQTHQTQLKSSPFINGEYVHLDEIQTDSDSEDSEDERERKANLPDWVLTPNLQQTLMSQETQNPDAVFGPIAPLNMNDIFKDAQARQRLRNRTSSANWFGTDRLSEEDKIRDLEAREKMRQDGGWSFDHGV